MTTTTNPAGSLRLAPMLQTLRAHGVEVADPYATSPTFLDCDRAAVTFTRSEAQAVEMHDHQPGRSLKPSPLITTLHLNETQLRKATSIVSGQTSDLTPKEQAGVQACKDIERSGASLELLRHGLHAPGLLQVVTAGLNAVDVQERVKVPQDESGRAMVLLLLENLSKRNGTTDGTYRMDVRVPAIVVNGAPMKIIHSIDDLIASAHDVRDRPAV